MSKVIGDRGTVAVIGAGIAGMQAALLLADMGIKVYLIEREAFIGGKFSLLDITFPTNSCGICFLSPKQPAYCPVYECRLHENVEPLTLTEVKETTGEVGDFQLTLIQHPRLVDASRCNLCGKCRDTCPVDVPREQGAATGKAIDLPPFQATPRSYVIDFRHCTRCGRCAEVCPCQAIDLDQEEEELVIHAGAIINAPGFEPFDARRKGEYGFGRYENVFSSIQFERMLSTNGPTAGIPRRADGKEIKKLAIIQCVGSRDPSCGQEQCSNVCCMIAAKQALLAKDRTPEMEIAVFYMDVRPLGKDYERYYESVRAKKGVTYRRGAVSAIHELSRTKDLLIGFIGEDGLLTEEPFDAVVLSLGYQTPPPPPPQPGVFAAVPSQGPGDITDTVIAGAGAAAMAASCLGLRSLPTYEVTSHGEASPIEGVPRIGILFWNPGREAPPFADRETFMAKARKLPGVIQVETVEADSLAEGKTIVSGWVKEHDINRIIWVGPSPKDVEGLVGKMARASGINPSLISFANIGAVRTGDDAWALVRMAWERARRLQPLNPRQIVRNQSVLVIGGGLAGMTASLRLAEMGYQVYLVEKEAETGGNLRQLSFTLAGVDPGSVLAELRRQIEAMPNIHLWTESEVLATTKNRGTYQSKVRRKDGMALVEHGAVIIATGGREIRPEGYEFNEDPRILTQRQLGGRLLEGREGIRGVNTIVMIQCVNSRDETHPYCSRICCPQAVKHALVIKELSPHTEIYVLYRDMRTCGSQETAYRQARETGVIFINYDSDEPPEVTLSVGNISVSVRDPVLRERISLSPDLLVLSMGIEPEDNRGFAEILRADLDADGFFKAAHPKAAPLDTLDKGKYFCGICLAPNNLEAVIAQAQAVAARVAAFLSARGEEEACQSYVIKRFCSHCGLCIGICPYGARSFNSEDEVEVAGEVCLGCGACVVICNSGACRQYNQEIQLHMGMVDAAID